MSWVGGGGGWGAIGGSKANIQAQRAPILAQLACREEQVCFKNQFGTPYSLNYAPQAQHRP